MTLNTWHNSVLEITKTHFDYIIIGAGLAGLMLADAMGNDGFFDNKSILLLDKDAKSTNDRTWCYWEKGKGEFDAIVSKTWKYIFFGGQKFSNRLNILPYSYKLIRGIDFYEAYLNRLNSYPNISFLQEEVHKIEASEKITKVITKENAFSSNKVFNSIFDYNEIIRQKKYPVLQQHFIGWFVKTQKPVFIQDQATFMDFSVPQKGNTRFMYVLPFSENEALVEYTLFSETPLSSEEYEAAIRQYLNEKLNCTDFQILEKEKGNIPMTCYDFSQHNSNNVVRIGTAGGWAKASTGYTFYNTNKKTKALISHLKNGRTLKSFDKKTKFWYYDLLLLDILFKKNSRGQYIFETLFKNRPPQLIFKFLDEETSFWEDLKIISGCPKKEFLRSLVQRIFN